MKEKVTWSSDTPGKQIQFRGNEETHRDWQEKFYAPEVKRLRRERIRIRLAVIN